MKDFLAQLLGDQSIPQFAGSVFFALIGILIRLLYHATQRNQASPNTPIDFSWLFLLKNNAMRLALSNALSLLLIIITIRFSDDILHVHLNQFIALIVGFGSDTLAEKFKEASRQIMPYKTIDVTSKPEKDTSWIIPPPIKIDTAKAINEQMSPAQVVSINNTEKQQDVKEPALFQDPPKVTPFTVITAQPSNNQSQPVQQP